MTNLLMLHGWGFPAAVFEALYNELDSEFTIDMSERPGYGNKFDQQADKGAAVCLSSPTLVVGWSLGGLDALQLAMRQPDLVTGLVLLATTPCFVNRQDWRFGMDKGIFDAFRKQVDEDQAGAMQKFVRLNAASKPDRQTRTSLAGQSGRVTPAALRAGLDELESTDLRDFIEHIEMPVLLLNAADDRVVPAEASRWLQRQLPASRLIEFPVGGHAFFLQYVKEVANQIMRFAND